MSNERKRQLDDFFLNPCSYRYFLNQFNTDYDELFDYFGVSFSLVFTNYSETINEMLDRTKFENRNILMKISHETKTACISINSIIHSVSVLISSFGKNNIINIQDALIKISKYIERVSFQSEVIINTIHQMNDFTDDFNSLNKVPGKVNLREELIWSNSYGNNLLKISNKSRVKMKAIINEKIGNPIISVEKDKFKIILSELIKNAVKNTTKGEIELGLDYLSESKKHKSSQNFNFIDNSISHEKDKKCLCLWISDSGQGMNSQELYRLKTQLESTNDSPTLIFENTGTLRLGFITIKNYARDLNINIDIFSKEHEGTTCILRFNQKLFTYNRPNSITNLTTMSSSKKISAVKNSNEKSSKCFSFNNLYSIRNDSVTKASSSLSELIRSFPSKKTINLESKISLFNRTYNPNRKSIDSKLLLIESNTSPPSNSQNNIKSTFSSMVLFNMNYSIRKVNEFASENYFDKDLEEMSSRLKNEPKPFLVKFNNISFKNKKDTQINNNYSITETDRTKTLNQFDPIEQTNESNYYSNRKSAEDSDDEVIIKEESKDMSNINTDNDNNGMKLKENSEERNDNLIFDFNLSLKGKILDANKICKSSEVKTKELLRNISQINCFETSNANESTFPKTPCELKIKIRIDKPYIIFLDDEFYCNKSSYTMMKVIKAEKNLQVYDYYFSDGTDFIKFFLEAIVNKAKIKLVVSDENMQFMNGSKALEAIQKMQSLFNSSCNIPPSYILTALDGYDVTSEIQQRSKCIDVIRKPMSKTTLVECLIKVKLINE